MANLNVTVVDGNNINVQVTPTPDQVINIDRGVAGNGIESITDVVIDDYSYLDIVYTNGTSEQIGPIGVSNAILIEIANNMVSITAVANDLTTINDVAANLAAIQNCDTNMAAIIAAPAEAAAAATSAADALASENAAAASAADALASEQMALVYKDTAATMAYQAQQSRDAAALSASAAATSAGQASTSSDDAATSAANALASEISASGSAGSALASENAAAASEYAAATSEANAAASAADALASEQATTALYDSFDDRYLGAKNADPSTDNDGNPLIVGALYFNTTSNQMRVWNGTAWEIAYVPSSTYLQIANNLSDVQSVSDSRDNLGLGTAAVLDAGVANGVASLDGAGTVPTSQLPAAVLGAVSYQGTWNASTNTPTLTSGVGTKGFYYVVSVAGTTNLDGIADWQIGDWAIYSGTAWQKIDNTDLVQSVNGQTGVVVLSYSDVGAASSAQGALADTAIQSITSADGSIVVVDNGTSIDLAVSEASPASTLLTPVRNTTGATLTKGTVVYISGATGQIATVSKALATSDTTSAQTLGMITSDLPNNTNGYVTVFGLITDIDTSAYSDGAQLYLSGTVAGAVTSTKPSAPTHLVYVAVVEYAHAVHGKLLVKVQNGYELDELHDVSITSPATYQTITYNSATGLWSNGTVSLSNGVNGILPVANGGTGSDTASGARTNLSVPSTTGSGASGIWNISISGNAATSSNSSALDGNTSSYYQPASTAITTSNIGSQTVASANTATTATNVSGGTASVTTLTTSSTVTLNGNTASTVPYLNASKVLTTTSGFAYAPDDGLTVQATGAQNAFTAKAAAGGNVTYYRFQSSAGANYQTIAGSSSTWAFTNNNLGAYTNFYSVTSGGVGNIALSLIEGYAYFPNAFKSVSFANNQVVYVNASGYAVSSSSMTFDGTTFSAAVTTQAAKTSNTTIASTAFVDRLRSLLAQNLSSTGGTATSADRGCLVVVTGTVTIPSATFTTGDTFTIYNNSASSISIAQGAGVTLRLVGTATTGTRTLAQRGLATVVFISSGEAVISGGGLT